MFWALGTIPPNVGIGADLTVGRMVREWAVAQGAQRPVFKTNVSGFASLREVRPPIDIEILRALCMSRAVASRMGA